ncbi:hypothetical protein [Oleiphilus sp. HI0128]|uniref:hypothetical protein n=1 Tax=Oleiphilus sp. HI0128 TaxID=1822267 RepID=UPI0007C243A6|nr:hypothetical protein [Oleiphilus sp. HI0128]KZZ65586.1 hypothetical protein A3763_18335 [Oleiphilus sp. HI0128]
MKNADDKLSFFVCDEDVEDKLNQKPCAMLFFWWFMFHMLKKKKKPKQDHELKLRFRTVDELLESDKDKPTPPSNRPSPPDGPKSSK